MNVHAHETEPRAPRSGGCSCGCGGKCGCESRCCDLECLVRPNFFCGQLLTDADLDASVDWARNRFSLARYRHGWGVVCGLDVTCSHPGGTRCCPDSEKGPTVYVHPGYAIDCCGNDLVVCDPLAVDLSDICRPADDPCLPRREKAKGHGNGNGSGKVYGKGNGDSKSKEDLPEEDYQPEDCWQTLGADLFAVNLTLRYHEDMAHGQRAMFRSGCSDSGACEYSRVLENPCVHAEIGVADCYEDEEYQSWSREFEIRRVKAEREIQAALKAGPEGVLQYLRRHPPYKFCFLEELVCCLIGQPEPDSDGSNAYERRQQKNPDSAIWRGSYGRIEFWLYLDWLQHELECPCWVCKPDRGVPLARVLLKRMRVRGEDTCRVMLIDVSVPHRRPLRKDVCRPVPRGAIDLAPYLWQSDQYVRDQLGSVGVTVNERQVASEAELVGKLGLDALLIDTRAARRVDAFIVTDPFKCKRVVAFGSVDNT
jgi:hypothetical protein